MIVSSQSDRHIARRGHAHTVSGASPNLVHSSSLDSLRDSVKREPLKDTTNEVNGRKDNEREQELKRKEDPSPVKAEVQDFQIRKSQPNESELLDSQISKDSNLSDLKVSKDSSDTENIFPEPPKEGWKLSNSNSKDSKDAKDTKDTKDTKDKDAKEAKDTKEKEGGGGTFNFLAFRKVFTARELTVAPKKSVPRPLMRQKSYFLEELMSFKESSLRATDLVSLPKILEDRVGMITFRNFLKSVLADENLQFWRDVVAFKECPVDQKVYEARKIYILYIHEKAAYPLNVASHTKKAIQEKIEGGNESVIEEGIFNEAQMEAYDMLERDLFPRFRKSPYFHRLQEGLDENLINHMVKKKTGFLSIFHS